ncbi:thioredoxin 1 [Mycoplasmoides fastidiosum]|uniref:Thioredoxin n=1 Tax=Mycoplasmoides fastidiosum TaxID=92758 RepID=A0ABU0LY82_9BACT|nr:thioredoxin family protein [Mycoplasmoides fastidiosum]MDQ0513671.1 thioredoxin 1 [Mycoplasmoides fastidiosum]UUD37910.1 thioredoxin family protein [Mycoplasmoides fastidiosum]
MKSYIEVESNEQFQSLLASEKRVIVDFYATWCPPCTMFKDTLERVYEGNSLADDIQIIKVNVDTLIDSARAHSVHSLPTVVFFQDEREVRRFLGFRPAKDFLTETKEAFGDSAVK